MTQLFACFHFFSSFFFPTCPIMHPEAQHQVHFTELSQLLAASLVADLTVRRDSSTFQRSEEIHCFTLIKNDNIISIPNINSSLPPNILRPGKSGRGERSSGAFVCVRSSQYGLPSMGMLKRGGGRGYGTGGGTRGEGHGKRGIYQPPLGIG